MLSYTHMEVSLFNFSIVQIFFLNANKVLFNMRYIIFWIKWFMSKNVKCLTLNYSAIKWKKFNNHIYHPVSSTASLGMEIILYSLTNLPLCTSYVLRPQGSSIEPEEKNKLEYEKCPTVQTFPLSSQLLIRWTGTTSQRNWPRCERWFRTESWHRCCRSFVSDLSLHRWENWSLMRR